MTAPVPHSTRAHATLAPSSAHRWMSCPGSVRMSVGIPNTSSVFAAEGTAAHEICAKCLEEDREPIEFLGWLINTQPGDGKTPFSPPENILEPADGRVTFEVTEEMADAVAQYTDHVRSLGTGDPERFILNVEQRLDMTHLHPQIFGTGDATLLDIEQRHLHVVDFKYGKGVAVDADDNPQLLLYAAGALRRHHNHRVDKLTMHVVQPRAEHRAGPVRSFEIDLIDLLDFESDIIAGARATEAPDAPLAAGEWCRFCPALASENGICPVAREKAIADAGLELDAVGDLILPAVDEISDEQEAQVLRNADAIGNFVKAVQERAHKRACDGRAPKGFKLVAKRANRRWRDEDEVVEYLEILGVAKDDMFVEPKLKSPAQMERVFPGKNAKERQSAQFDAGLVVKQSSGTNLVAETDPRPPVNFGASAELEAVDAE